ncbi:hypothetical protein E1B28_011844 [Marasmius oreades]|uniref:Uncharacterized protein n=1 Tax=Marasmius oreades TaxID=181124 RepID=A0A9P7RW19_9AGAR|nr:uncharacterized protein E1B28_011844 [Marasmius oreades]KAG7090246.1 hypothetical protein E1B28_011844 [Marasmius oreades]
MSSAMGTWHTWSMGEAQPGSSILSDSATYERSLYFFVTTLAFNLVCTTLVVHQLWRTRQGLTEHVAMVTQRRSRYYGVSRHQVTKMFTIIHSAYFILYNSMPPLVGSVFSFVILRSAVQDNNDGTHTQSSSLTLTNSNANANRGALRTLHSPLQVHVTHKVVKRMPENECWDAEPQR